MTASISKREAHEPLPRQFTVNGQIFVNIGNLEPECARVILDLIAKYERPAWELTR